MTYYESAAAAPPLARSTRRPSAEFDEFVLRYARAQRANVGLVFVGLGLAIGAAIRLDGGLMVAFAAVGLGIAGAGGGGFLAAAEANGGRLTRDAATKVLPRALYRDWATTAGEFQRLGMIDGDGMVTPAGRGMMRGGSPFPTGDYAPTGAHSTHARRTHDAHGVVWGES